MEVIHHGSSSWLSGRDANRPGEGTTDTPPPGSRRRILHRHGFANFATLSRALLGGPRVGHALPLAGVLFRAGARRIGAHLPRRGLAGALALAIVGAEAPHVGWLRRGRWRGLLSEAPVGHEHHGHRRRQNRSSCCSLFHRTSYRFFSPGARNLLRSGFLSLPFTVSASGISLQKDRGGLEELATRV